MWKNPPRTSDIWHTDRKHVSPSESVPIQSRVAVTPSLFNFWQSLFTRQLWWQVHHYTNINRAFPWVEWFLYKCVWARSTEEFSLSLILFQIHFCVWRKSTSVKTNMKRRPSSQEIDSFGCLFKLETIFMLCSVAQQQVVDRKLSLWALSMATLDGWGTFIVMDSCMIRCVTNHESMLLLLYEHMKVKYSFIEKVITQPIWELC